MITSSGNIESSRDGSDQAKPQYGIHETKLLSFAVRAALGICSFAAISPSIIAAQDATIIEEVLVVGTRIQRANLISVSPVTQIDAEEIQLAGVTRVEDLLRNLPQVYSQQNASNSNDATGIATLDLRNLGTERTLVLIDGRRLPQGSPLSAGAADINQVPGALIDRVEVLTGGASAVYGSDAMAGVVNFRLVNDFEGVQLDYQFSQYAHDNDNAMMKRLLNQANEPVPSGTERDGDISDVALMIGGNLDGGRGNVTAYATYRDIEEVLQADRIHSACALDGEPGDYYCWTTPITEEGYFSDFASYGFMVQGNEFVPWDGRTFNFGPFNYFQRPDERWTAGAFGHYAISRHAEVYTQLMFTDDRTVSQIAPSGLIFETISLSCDNPLLSQQQFDVLCAEFGLGPEDDQAVYIGRRNVEGGPRQDDIRHTSFRGVFGLRGNIDDVWRYDLYGQYAEVSLEQTYENELLLPNMIRALDVTTDPNSGDAVCRSALSGVDPNCVPWNIFREGGVTQEALDYISVPLFTRGTTDQTIVSAYIAANLADYGLHSPFAETGVDLVLGAEYREENLDKNPDDNASSGDVPTFGVSSFLSGGFDVTEFFVELSLPLVEARPLAESLVLDLGYRYSDYSTGETTDTYKIAASWSLTNNLRLRASYQRAVRAANISELFQDTGHAFFWMPGGDPCAGDNPARSFEECARSGVSAEQYGSIPDSSDGENIQEILNFQFGGNPELQSESSDTYSAGLLYWPKFIDGLSISFDWFDIEIDDYITWVDAEGALLDCLESGDAWSCKLIHREERKGTLWLDDEAYVDTSNRNIGFLSTSGYDLVLDYTFDAGQAGRITAHNILTYVDEWRRQQNPAASALDCQGKWSQQCWPTPELRNHLRLTWTTPWQLTLSGLWRHIGSVDSVSALQEDIDAYNYFDVSLLWEINGSTMLRAGVNNVFDEEPPTATHAAPPLGNGNTIPGMYDALGQYWFAGVTVSL